MKIVIDKESIIKVFAVAFYAVSGGDYSVATDAVKELLEKIDYEPYEERTQGNCQKCDYRKFTETFIDGVVELMNKNGITSVEQLSKILEGGAE